MHETSSIFSNRFLKFLSFFHYLSKEEWNHCPHIDQPLIYMNYSWQCIDCLLSLMNGIYQVNNNYDIEFKGKPINFRKACFFCSGSHPLAGFRMRRDRRLVYPERYDVIHFACFLRLVNKEELDSIKVMLALLTK